MSRKSSKNKNPAAPHNQERRAFALRFCHELQAVLRHRSFEDCHRFFQQILGFGLELVALKEIEKSQPLMATIEGRPDGSSHLPADRARLLLTSYTQYLIRAGHFGRARQLLETRRRSQRQFSLEPCYQEALLRRSLWDHEGARELLEKAAGAPGATPLMRIEHLHQEARCRFMRSKIPGALAPQLAEIASLLSELRDEDLSGTVTLCHADVLAMNGDPEAAYRLISRKIIEVSERRLHGNPVNSIHLAELHLGASRYLHKLQRPSSECEAHLEAGFRLSLDSRQNYLYLLHHIFERVRAFGWPEGARALHSLHGHLPGFDPSGTTRIEKAREHLPSMLRPARGVRLCIDLAADEYRLASEAHPRLGIPLEIKLIAWVALFSPIGSVPRTLVLDLLWPDTPAGTTHLQLRLSKLIARAEEISGLSLRSDEKGELLLSPSNASKVQVAIGAPGARPSYFATQSPAKKSVSELGAHYGLKRSQAGRWMKEALEKGWLLPGEARTRGRVRRGA